MAMLDRCGALSGAASVLLVIVGGDVLGTPPGPQVAHPSGERHLANMQWLSEHTSAQVGISLELLGLTLMIVFVAYLTTRLQGAGWLATAALAGGVAEVVIKLGSGATVFAAYLLREDLSPQTAQMLFDINGAAFVITWLPMGLFVACAAAAGLMTGVLRRILGWGGVVAGVSCVLVTAATGVEVLSANFVPFLLCVLWTLLVSLRLGAARTNGSSAESATPDAIPVPA